VHWYYLGVSGCQHAAVGGNFNRPIKMDLIASFLKLDNWLAAKGRQLYKLLNSADVSRRLQGGCALLKITISIAPCGRLFVSNDFKIIQLGSFAVFDKLCSN
jgi:hypothetical protein